MGFNSAFKGLNECFELAGGMDRRCLSFQNWRD